MLTPFFGGAQDFDLYLHGRVTDAASGEPVPYAQIRVTDQLDPAFEALVTTTASGDFTRELYTSAAWQGGRYEVHVSAEGHQARTALVDASIVGDENDINVAWRIRMDVQLSREGQETGLPAAMGTCVYDPSRATFRWKEKEARRTFSVERYTDPRILAHAQLVDSVNALDGVLLQGRVLDQWNEKAMPGAQITISTPDGSLPPMVLFTDSYGFYVYSLPYDRTYELDFSSEEMVSKSFIMDLTSIPEQMKEEGFSTLLDVRLFGPLEGEDLSFLQEPLSRMNYSSGEKNLVWDMNASRPALERLDGIVARHSATVRY
jgi:hypothetical protein